jgi:hypothetical protein
MGLRRGGELVTFRASMEWVRGQVAAVQREAGRGYNDLAHETEDSLREAVLQMIAGGASDPAELAREALRTVDIGFRRRCS